MFVYWNLEYCSVILCAFVPLHSIGCAICQVSRLGEYGTNCEARRGGLYGDWVGLANCRQCWFLIITLSASLNHQSYFPNTNIVQHTSNKEQEENITENPEQKTVAGNEELEKTSQDREDDPMDCRAAQLALTRPFVDYNTVGFLFCAFFHGKATVWQFLAPWSLLVEL